MPKRSTRSLWIAFLVACTWIASLQLTLFVAVHSRRHEHPPPTGTTARGPMLRPTVVLFGDSLTQHSFDEGEWSDSMATLFLQTQ